jgi:hypothetical protein
MVHTIYGVVHAWAIHVRACKIYFNSLDRVEKHALYYSTVLSIYSDLREADSAILGTYAQKVEYVRLCQKARDRRG